MTRFNPVKAGRGMNLEWYDTLVEYDTFQSRQSRAWDEPGSSTWKGPRSCFNPVKAGRGMNDGVVVNPLEADRFNPVKAGRGMNGRLRSGSEREVVSIPSKPGVVRTRRKSGIAEKKEFQSRQSRAW